MLTRFIKFNKRISAACERRWPGVFGSDNCTEELIKRIRCDIESKRPGRILECGGIDRPLLSKSAEFRYIGLDIETRSQCFEVYDEFHVQSVEEPIDANVDMIISTTLLEHVRDNRRATRQIYDALSIGGTTHHYVPSKHHPYSVILRMLGPRVQKKLIALLRSEASEVSGYPAFFDSCSPGEMKRLFTDSGFARVDVRPFYRANDYFDFFFPAYVLMTVFENLCRACRWSTFCSGFVISATKAPPDRLFSG